MSENKHVEHEPPPFFPKWNHWYVFVVVLLVAEVLFFYMVSN